MFIHVQLPDDASGDGAGNVQAVGANSKVNIFRLRVELASLQAELMEHVYLLPASGPSSVDSMGRLKVIASKLKAWRQNGLFQLTADNLRTHLHRSDLVHITVLEAAYFCTVYALCYHSSPDSGSKKLPFAAEALAGAVSSKTSLPLSNDARRFIHLLQSVPGANTACKW